MDFYKILFNKPIESRKIFSIDLSDGAALKSAIEHIQYLHKDSIAKKGLKMLWNRFEALFPENVAGILYSKEVVATIRKLIKNKYGEKCGDDEIVSTLERIVCEKFDPSTIKPYRGGRGERKSKKPATGEIKIVERAKGEEAAEEVPSVVNSIH